MKVFSKEKFLNDEATKAVIEELGCEELIESWANDCDGKEVIDGKYDRYAISDAWCIEKKGGKTMKSNKEKEVKQVRKTGMDKRERLLKGNYIRAEVIVPEGGKNTMACVDGHDITTTEMAMLIRSLEDLTQKLIAEQPAAYILSRSLGFDSKRIAHIDERE